MANRQHTEFFCNRPEARKKSYFVYEERVTSFYEYDEDLATGDIEIDKVLFEITATLTTWALIAHMEESVQLKA